MRKLVKVLFILPLILTMANCKKGKTNLNESSTYVNSSNNSITSNQTTTSEKTIDINMYTTPQAPKYNSINEENYIVYYFDSVNGNDSNSGLSTNLPMKTLSSINDIIKNSTKPLKLLLKCGSLFKESVKIDYHEFDENNPLLISNYGDGNMPIISGTSDDCIKVMCDNFRIENIEFTNPNGSRGIFVETGKNGSSKNIVIKNCYFHEIGWTWKYETPVEDAVKDIYAFWNTRNVKDVCPDNKYIYSTCAIYFSANAGDKINPRWFENIFIENNKIRCVGRSGIITSSSWQSGNGCSWGGYNKYYSTDKGWYPPKNVVIKGNDLMYLGGDGIVTIGAEDCWITENTCFYSAMLGRYGYACAGIWPVNSRRVYIERNEAAYTFLVNGCTDGQGFDIDIGCHDIIFQQNYSHDNDGGGLLICNVHGQMPLYDENGFPVLDEETSKQKTFESPGNWNNVKIRNNLFVYNGKCGTNPAFITASSDCKNIICENNMIIMNPNLYSQHLIYTADWGRCGYQENFILRNNIIYAEEDLYSVINMNSCQSYLFENNLYYNFGNSFFDEYSGIEDKKAITSIDPEISIPENRNGLDKVALYKPKNKEVYSKGELLSEISSYDILGNKVNNGMYLGAFFE